MSLAAEKELEHISESCGVADHDHDLSKRLRRSVALRPVHRQRRGQTGLAGAVVRPKVPGDRQHQAYEASDHRGSPAELLLTEAFRHWPVALEAALAVRRAQAAKDIAEDYGVRSNLFFLR